MRTPTIDQIRKHYSVRTFTPDPVAPALVETIVSAAQRSATSSNLQLYSVVAVTDAVRRDQLAGFCGDQEQIRQAPVFLAWCADRHITPNAVTMTGVLLMLFAGWCFYEGLYMTGLIAGWIMTFLDTVDGKLARVTVQSSRFGHFLDHGMDIVHPPFWYWVWGLSLAVPPSLFGMDAQMLYVALFAGYIGGRVAEGLFHQLGDLALFTWRPFDAYFRLITARRNPCMILLTAFTLLGRPDWAFLSVVICTVGKTLLLFVRLLQDFVLRLMAGPLTSWMQDPQAAAAAYPRAYRTFSTTRSAYGDG